MVKIYDENHPHDKIAPKSNKNLAQSSSKKEQYNKLNDTKFNNQRRRFWTVLVYIRHLNKYGNSANYEAPYEINGQLKKMTNAAGNLNLKI